MLTAQTYRIVLTLPKWTLLKSRRTKKIASHVNSFLGCLQKKQFSQKERHTGRKYTTMLIGQIGHRAVCYNSKVMNNCKLAWPSSFPKMFVSLVQ